MMVAAALSFCLELYLIPLAVNLDSVYMELVNTGYMFVKNQVYIAFF